MEWSEVCREKACKLEVIWMKNVNLAIPSSTDLYRLYYPSIIHKDCYMMCIRNPGWLWRWGVWCRSYVCWLPGAPEAPSLEAVLAADRQTPPLSTLLFPPLHIFSRDKTSLQHILPFFLLPSIDQKIQICLTFFLLTCYQSLSSVHKYCALRQGRAIDRTWVSHRFCYFYLTRVIKHHKKHEALITVSNSKTQS